MREDIMLDRLQTRGIAHFSIPVTNSKRSEQFYHEILGLPVLAADHKVGMVFLDSGGDCIILVRSEAAETPPEGPNVHHAFVVDHDAYRDSVEFLKSKGIEILFEEDRQGGVVNGPRAYFHDPDGNVLEIIDLTHYSGAA
jgi:catechol 2,3-dioxygenase-like lactoylglutathione lyase family enzyme